MGKRTIYRSSVVLSVFLAGCLYLPYRYQTGVPNTAGQMVLARAGEIDRVLVVPCWTVEKEHRVLGRSACGPPVIVEDDSVLNLKEVTETWTGWKMLDYVEPRMGHEPNFVGLAAISSQGTIVWGSHQIEGFVQEEGEWTDHEYRDPRPSEKAYFWLAALAATIGPAIKASLMDIFSTNSPVEYEPWQMALNFGSERNYFGAETTTLVGGEKEIAEALRFVESLPGDGDDVWKELPIFHPSEPSLPGLDEYRDSAEHYQARHAPKAADTN